MPSISKINCKKIINDKVLNNIVLKKCIYEPAKNNPTLFVGRMALFSALTKDAIGCYYYVKQSLHNEEIPDDKRNFVAAIDLMNGVLNVGLQFTIGKYIEKKTPWLFDNTVGNILHIDKTREISKKISDNIGESDGISREMIEKHLRANKVLGAAGSKGKWLNIGFSAAVMLLMTQVFTKRVIVPLLATPMAGWFKEKFMDKKKTPEEMMTPAMINSTMAKTNIDSFSKNSAAEMAPNNS